MRIRHGRAGLGLLALGLAVVGAACSRGGSGLVDTLATLPADVAFVARLEPARLGPPAQVAQALAAAVERLGGPTAGPVATLVGGASALTAVRGAPPSDTARCGAAAAHVADLMRASAGGHAPLEADVAATRRACERLDLADCLLAARTQQQAVTCATTRAVAGEPWAVVFEGLADPDAAAITLAAALGLRVRPDVPRYADERWAAHPLPGRLVAGHPGLVRALCGVTAGGPSSAADGPLAALARELPAGSALQLAYVGLGTPPSLRAAALALSQDDGVALSWHLAGDGALTGQVAEQLRALRRQALAGRVDWVRWLVLRLGVAAGDAESLAAAVPALVDAAVVTPRDGGARVTARAPLDLAAVLASLAARVEPSPAP